MLQLLKFVDLAKPRCLSIVFENVLRGCQNNFYMAQNTANQMFTLLQETPHIYIFSRCSNRADFLLFECYLGGGDVTSVCVFLCFVRMSTNQLQSRLFFFMLKSLLSVQECTSKMITYLERNLNPNRNIKTTSTYLPVNKMNSISWLGLPVYKYASVVINDAHAVWHPRVDPDFQIFGVCCCAKKKISPGRSQDDSLLIVFHLTSINLFRFSSC